MMRQRNGHREPGSYPTQIAFEERSDGLWWLSGAALTDFKRLFGLRCDGRAVGFEPNSVLGYRSLVANRAVTFTVMRPHGIVAIGATKVCKPEPPVSRSIFLAAELLLDPVEHERMRKTIPLNDHRIAQLAGEEPGRVYVYQLEGGVFEIDWELTGIPRASVEAFLLACALTGKKVRCRLVEPKPRRGRRSERSGVTTESAATKGQLRLIL